MPCPPSITTGELRTEGLVRTSCGGRHATSTSGMRIHGLPYFCHVWRAPPQLHYDTTLFYGGRCVISLFLLYKGIICSAVAERIYLLCIPLLQPILSHMFSCQQPLVLSYLRAPPIQRPPASRTPYLTILSNVFVHTRRLAYQLFL